MTQAVIPVVGDPDTTQMSGYITGQQGAHQASYSQHYGAGDPAYTYPLLQSGNSTTHLLMRRDEANTTNFPVDTLDVNRMPTITSNYSVTARDMNKILLADCSSGDLTFTLAPAANVSSNFRCVVKRIDDSPNKVIIATTSGDLIDNKEQFELVCSYEYLGFASNTIDYYVYARTTPNPNLLINGALDYWPENPDFSIVGSGTGYIACLFKLLNNLAAITLDHERTERTFGDTLLPDEVRFYSTVTPSGTFSGGNTWSILHYTDDIVQWSGKTITYSAWMNFGSARTGVVSSNVILQYDTVGSGSVYVASSNQDVEIGWKKYTFTLDIPTLASHSILGYPYVQIGLNIISDYEDTVSFALLKCEFSDKATRWVPKPISQEVEDCAYFFKTSVPIGSYFGQASVGGAQYGVVVEESSTEVWANQSFGRKMRKSPSITIASPVTGSQGIITRASDGATFSVSSYDAGTDCINFIDTSGGLTSGNLMFYHYLADARF